MPRMFNSVMRVISSLIGVLIGTMMGQMEADSSDADLQNDPKQLPASQRFNYQRKAPASWVPAVSIAEDPKSTTALFTVAALFGFGVAL